MDSHDIHIDLRLKRSVDDVWQAWITSASLEKWLTVKAHVEPRLDGRYELFWDPSTPDENSTIGCRILAFVPHRLLAFQWKGPVNYAGIMNVEPPPTWVQVSLEPVSPTHTIAHFRHSGWQTGPQWSEARQWMEKSWRASFLELEKLWGEKAALRVVPLA